MAIKATMINPDRLTPRQADVAVLVAEGHADKMIARMLAMSIRTVGTHVASIYERLDIHTESLSANAAGLNMRVRAVAVMVARGMVQLSINSVFAFVFLNAVAMDDHATRVRVGGRHVGSSVSRVRRGEDA